MPRYPYAQALGQLEKLIEQLRKKFPAKVDADTLKKLNLAPGNESYLLNTLKFIGVIDSNGAPAAEVRKLFASGDEEFSHGLSQKIRSAYTDLFDLRGDDAWTLPKDQLQTFFRQEDRSSNVVGGRQADTFIRLAEIAGRRERAKTPSRPSPTPSRPSRRSKTGAGSAKEKAESPALAAARTSDLALTLRIELHLPVSTDQEVYDKIFESLRRSLLDRG